MNYEDLFEQTDLLQERIKQNQNTIRALLGRYEPYETAQDEITRSISALAGIRQEFAAMTLPVHDLVIATFFPLNLPLYSLVLFAIIPSLFATKVFVRAPSVMQAIIQDLVDLLGLQEIMPEIIIKNVNRAIFLQVYARPADVILFTGRYENALAVQEQCPDALMIFNGGGVNPAIVFENADVTLAASKICEMRTFNSGQDCAGTDAIFVHRSVYKEFVACLEAHLDSLKIGLYDDPTTQVGPILKREYVAGLASFLKQEEKHIIRRGKLDLETSLVHPYIIAKSASEHVGGFHEFFAPVFYILVFDDSEELEHVLFRPIIQDYSMYVTYFGSNPIVHRVTKARLLHDYIVNDVEQGNYEYGGFGEKANFVAFGDVRAARPILISREIHSFYLNDGIVPLQPFADRNIQQPQPVFNHDLVGTMQDNTQVRKLNVI